MKSPSPWQAYLLLRDVNYIIDTRNTNPVSRAMYCMSLKEKAEVKGQVPELLEKGCKSMNCTKRLCSVSFCGTFAIANAL